MSNKPKVLVYGASGYTGKMVSEYLAKLGIPFYAAGRSADRVAEQMEIVQQRLGDVKLECISLGLEHSVEALTEAFQDVDVVINNVGPFMQLGEPVVEACAAAGTHYLDTTGEQDWCMLLKDKYHQRFADQGLLLSPANSYMWCAGAIAAEYVLDKNPDIDMLDIVYQIDNAVPSVASTKSFLRMVCCGQSQLYLQGNEYKEWPLQEVYNVTAPHRSRPFLALPWSGGAEPVWFSDDNRVKNCSVLVGFGDDIIRAVEQAIQKFVDEVGDASGPEQEEWTNNFGAQMTSTEPQPDEFFPGRSMITVRGQGQQTSATYQFNLSAPYRFTGVISADIAARLLTGYQLKKVGFQSAPQAFGYRPLLETYAEMGFCNPL